MTQELDLYSRIQDPIIAIEKFGAFFARSGMFGCEKAEQGMVLAMACLVERKSPIELKRRYHLYQGELSMRADAMLADFRTKAGGRHKILARTPAKAAVELSCDGNSYLFEFTWADAEKEPFIYDRHGKVKTNYATPRARMQMLWARAVSDGVHAVAPEIVAGVYTPEELADIPAAPDAPLLPTQPETSASATRPARTPTTAKPKIIDIKATPVHETQTPPPAPPANPPSISASPAPDPDQPTPTPAAPQPAPRAPLAVGTNPKTGCIDAATADAIQALVPKDLEAVAITWLESKGWIKPLGSLLDLKPNRARMLLTETEQFLASIRAFQAKTVTAAAAPSSKQPQPAAA